MIVWDGVGQLVVEVEKMMMMLLFVIGFSSCSVSSFSCFYFGS